MISGGGWVSTVGRIQEAPFFVFFFLLCFCFNPVYSATNPNYTACAPQTCDGIPVQYPFSLPSQLASGCGYPGLSLLCHNNQSTLLLQTPTLNFTVNAIDYSAGTIDVAIDPNYMVGTGICRYPRKNISLEDIKVALPLFFTDEATTTETFYNCTPAPPASDPGGYGSVGNIDFSSNMVCSWLNGSRSSYAFLDGPPGNFGLSNSCQSFVSFPASASSNRSNLVSTLKDGFSMKWTTDTMNDCGVCSGSGGRCGSDSSGNLICFCPSYSHKNTCQHTRSVKMGLIAGIASATICVLLMIIACVLYSCKRSTFFRGSDSLTTTKLERFLSEYKSLTITRYTYNEIKRMTNKFEQKLGQGAYGSVFKGMLPNGHLVAVKLMEKSYKEGEEFINEVATIGRIHHVNVVRLVGFCVEGSKRALIYEFMANGSLDKLIQMNEATGHSLLTWEKLQSIAVAIARGIEYLDQGCDQRIIPFDIKPHNILLDADFTPKISDFGLAKLHCREQSLVSITQGKGTIGYVAPEVFYGNFTHVSHKSDVYSFGMLLLAMVGMKDKANFNGSNTSDAYFPQCIYHHLCDNNRGPQVVNGIGEEIMRKITIIALWCIQWDAVDRPSMKEVLSMFDSDITDLEMPPNRFFPAPAAQSDCIPMGFTSSSFTD